MKDSRNLSFKFSKLCMLSAGRSVYQFMVSPSKVLTNIRNHRSFLSVTSSMLRWIRILPCGPQGPMFLCILVVWALPIFQDIFLKLSELLRPRSPCARLYVPIWHFDWWFGGLGRHNLFHVSPCLGPHFFLLLSLLRIRVLPFFFNFASFRRSFSSL